MANRLRTFFVELKRRKVYHVAVAYTVVGVGVLSAAEVILDPLGFQGLRPHIVVLVLLGFPIALILAWAYEIRPEEPRGSGSATTPGSWAPDASSPIPPAQESAGLFPRDRIAVLPFASIHPDREHDYFADGITEELTSAISRIQGLDVIARTSVVKYKDSDARVRDIARDLNVGVVLEGSVRKAGDQLRVTVQLINAESEGHLWAEDYDREFREIFSVQRDIASHVADALRLNLLKPDAEGIERAPTKDLAAFDLYLLGRHHLGHRSDAGVRKAISSFQRAVESDTDFAPGYAGLADAYILAALGYMSEPPRDVVQQAREYAEHALRLNEGLPEAHTSLGYSALLGWDARAAETEFSQALQINPSHAQAHQWMGHALIVLKRPHDSIGELQRAAELDPLSTILALEVGFGYYYAGNYSEALARIDRALKIDDQIPIGHYNRGLNLIRLGRHNEAVESYERALELLPSMPYGRAHLAAAYAQRGQEDLAREILVALESEDSKDNPVRAYIAVVEEALGLAEEALASIREVIDRREPLGPYISLTWLPFESLQPLPEYQSLVQEIDEIIGR